MRQEKQLEAIVEPLVKWYQKEGRMLPWRETKNPYRIWISEIMLQQTKIEAVNKYYTKFMQVLPTIQELATVEEEKLLKLWEGLGYYNRAKNLKRAAMVIQERYNGQMPTTYEELVTLPGIGEYTAGAIASIAFHQKVPAVDGNVLRVLSRILASKENVLLANTKKKMTNKLLALIPEKAGDFNEGLMELGELICIPNGQPLCNKCPLQELCLAYKEDLISQIPVREKKAERRKEKKTVFVVLQKDKIAIQKRAEKGLLAGMYEFPNVEGHLTKGEIHKQFLAWGLQIDKIEEMGKHKHIFSHIEWEMQGYRIFVEEPKKQWVWISKEILLKQYPIPTAFAKFKDNI